MSILGDIRQQIRVRLATVQAEGVTPRLYGWDAVGGDLGPNALVIGIPASSFGKQGDPLGPDVEVGRWGWEMRWPVTLYVARTGDDRATRITDALQQEVVEALMSDVTLGGTCLASALDAASIDDTPDAEGRQASHHIVAWELVVTRYQNH